ncbi:MAG: RNA polymerase sigma factor [Lewinella sp.]|uniref:RNA polymerase sigma factor n=1 Tax=Lewinella sp. TaxID=2004506 RepID=UPI003D6B6363
MQRKYIDGLLTHDSKIIESIYRNYSHRIEHHVVRSGGSSEDARDVFQDALVIIYHKAQSPDFQLTSRFYTFLFGICFRLWERKRKKKSFQTMTIPVDAGYISDDDIEEKIFEREQYKIFLAAFEELDQICQQILTLFFAEKSMEEITQQTNLKNAHTTRNRKYRCQKKLEKLVKDDIRFQDFYK